MVQKESRINLLCSNLGDEKKKMKKNETRSAFWLELRARSGLWIICALGSG